MTSINLTLPVELVNHIIDKAVKLDPESAKTCALVCKAWVSESQRHVFSRVDFADGNHGFKKLFTASGKHATSVKTIYYYPSKQSLVQPPPILDREGLRDSFPNVRKLILVQINLGKLQSIPEFTALGETGVCSLEFLDCTMNINQLADYLRSFPHLKNLSIQFPTFYGEQKLDNPTNLPKSLSELHLSFCEDNTSQFLRRFSSFPFTFSKITMDEVGHKTNSLVSLLLKSKDTLTELKIHSSWGFVDLSGFTKLKTLHLTVSEDDRWDKFVSSLGVLERNLEGRQPEFHLTFIHRESNTEFVVEDAMKSANARLQHFQPRWNIEIDKVIIED